MRALAILLFFPFRAAAAAPVVKPSVFTPTSKAWVQAIFEANKPRQSQILLHNFLPGLKEPAPGVEMALVLAPLAQELEAAGLEAGSFASIDLETRDQAVLAAWDRAVQRVAREGQPSIDKMYHPPAPDPDLPIDAAKLHELQAHLSGYLSRDDDLLRRAYKVSRQRLAAMKTAEVQAAMARIAEALGRTPNEMAIHGADWLHAWSAEEAGVFPGNLDFWKTPDLKRDDFPKKVAESDALIGNIPLPVHTPNRGGLSPFGARQLILRFDETASAQAIDGLLSSLGLQVTSKSPDGRTRVAIVSPVSRERMATLLSTQPLVRSVVLPGRPFSPARQLTVRFNQPEDDRGLSAGDIELILGAPELKLRVLEALPGRTFRVLVGEDSESPLEEVAERLQRSAAVTYVVAHGIAAPVESQLVVRFKLASDSLAGRFVRDRHIGDVLHKLGLPILEVLRDDTFRLAVGEPYKLAAALEALAQEPLVLSVTPVAAALKAREPLLVEFKNADYDDLAEFFRRHDLLVLAQPSSGVFHVASGSGLGSGELAELLAREPLVARVSKP